MTYGEDYYATYAGPLYHWGEPYWERFFEWIATQIVETLRPATVLDVGCGVGFLVGMLRALGADARGIDSSAWAIGHGKTVVWDAIAWHDALLYRGPRVDLVTCIEVAEHVPELHAAELVVNLCRHADAVLFSSTPDDDDEPTHVNVQPPDYWHALFCRCGFERADYDASCIAPWATLYRRVGNVV